VRKPLDQRRLADLQCCSQWCYHRMANKEKGCVQTADTIEYECEVLPVLLAKYTSAEC
jgi:hypothetical protein